MSKLFLSKVLNHWGLPHEVYEYIIHEYIYKPISYLDEFQKLNTYFKYFFEYNSIELFSQWYSAMSYDLKYEMNNMSNENTTPCALKHEMNNKYDESEYSVEVFKNYYHDYNTNCVNILDTFNIKPKKVNIEHCTYPRLSHLIAHSDYTNIPYIRDHVIPFVFESFKTIKEKSMLNELFDLFVIRRHHHISQKDYMEELIYVEDMTDLILIENKKMEAVEFGFDIHDKLDIIMKL